MVPSPDERFEIARSNFQDSLNDLRLEFNAFLPNLPLPVRSSVSRVIHWSDNFLNEADDYINAIKGDCDD